MVWKFKYYYTTYRSRFCAVLFRLCFCFSKNDFRDGYLKTRERVPQVSCRRSISLCLLERCLRHTGIRQIPYSSRNPDGVAIRLGISYRDPPCARRFQPIPSPLLPSCRRGVAIRRLFRQAASPMTVW
jgi:hypothetical protein